MSATAPPFVPPFCPRSGCAYHRCPTGWRWVRFGSFRRQCAPRVIPRFRCSHCRATFSSQTFSPSYYLKRPDLLARVGYRILAGSGLRQITREARCAHATVMGLVGRLKRHAMLFLSEHRPPGPCLEPLVIDGFESFAFSQYQPLHLNLAVGAESHFIRGLTLSPLRRKGRMTLRQKRRRFALEQKYGRPEPKAIELDMAAAIRIAVPKPQALTVRSDEHPAYLRTLQRLRGYSIRHECTPSVQARTTGNPLFPVNLPDLLLRHNSANHKRESIAFSKRHDAVFGRAVWLVLWRNFCKPFSENHGGGTPAMRLGLMNAPLSIEKLLESRLFPSRIALPAAWEQHYRGRMGTPGINSPRQHMLKLAF